MIRIAKEMIDKENIKAVTTSCGFNAVFQKELAEALTVPVFTSALLQVPFVQCAIGYQRTVGVITANKSALTETHLRACGITADMKVEVLGLENAPEWSKIFDQPDKAFDIEVVSREIINVAKDGVKQFPDMGAIVLECTDLPPYAKRISEATGLPVFDFGSMMGHVAIALGDIDLY
jgi:Asp/Glu/hydantoin racemase